LMANVLIAIINNKMRNDIFLNFIIFIFFNTCPKHMYLYFMALVLNDFYLKYFIIRNDFRNIKSFF
jgi:hypothetical protein